MSPAEVSPENGTPNPGVPPAAVHPKHKFTRDSLGLAFTQYLVRAMSMGRGFVAAKLLDPMAFGAWNALQLMMDYGALAPLGTQQGLDQMVPARLVSTQVCEGTVGCVFTVTA